MIKILFSEAKALSEMSLRGRNDIESVRLFLNTSDTCCSIETS